MVLSEALVDFAITYNYVENRQNDVALLEEERLNEYNAIAQQITESINDRISAVEGAFLDLVANHQAPQQDSSVLRLLERLKSQQPLVEEATRD